MDSAINYDVNERFYSMHIYIKNRGISILNSFDLTSKEFIEILKKNVDLSKKEHTILYCTPIVGPKI